jgi:hypothetical protein
MEGGGLNIYSLVNNDPVNFNDENGLWDTPEHHALIERWLSLNPAPNGMDWAHYQWHCIELDVPALLEDGSDKVDGVGGGASAFCDAQSSANSYQHSMRAWYETTASARAKRDAFIKNLEFLAESDSDRARQNVALGCECRSDTLKALMEDAVTELGEAQHPLADDTSPPHAGFQVWFGPIDGCAILGPVGYLFFVNNHRSRETPFVYKSKGDGPANTVAGQMHPELLKILNP